MLNDQEISNFSTLINFRFSINFQILTPLKSEIETMSFDNYNMTNLVCDNWYKHNSVIV